MRRVIVTALCAAAFLFMRPEPAHAWWDWIDQLSGPGPFQGFDLQWRIVCVKDDRVTASDDSKDPSDSPVRTLKSFGPGAKEVWAGIFGAGCVSPGQHGVYPASSLNVRVAKLWSTDNHLQYANGMPGPMVHMWQLEPSFSTFVDDKKMVELTMGMGVSEITGEGFDSMTRVYFRPVMLTFTPGGKLDRSQLTSKIANAGNRLARSVNLSTGVIYIPKGFDAQDFGAVPGTFHTDHELLLTASVSIDISRL